MMVGPVGMGLTIAGAGISALGNLRSGAAANSMYQYQAAIAGLNQQIALQNRDYALGVGESQAREYGIKAAQERGKIRAAQGASGIDVGSQSSVDVRAGQELKKDIDLSTIRQNAARVAYGYSVQAAQEEAQGGLYRMAGEESEKAGRIKALGSLIGGASSVADKWLQAKSTGLELGLG